MHYAMNRKTDPTSTRRQWLRSLGRWTIGGALAAGAALLLRRDRDQCTEQYQCRGCPMARDCGLPQAVDHRQRIDK